MIFKEIDWDKFFTAQKELDAYIFEAKGLGYEETKEKRLLALSVELHELANATKAFKFWVSSPAGKREDILEEYVDVLHFILSLFIERKANLYGINVQEAPDKKGPDFLSYVFLELSVGFSTIVEKMFVLERSHETGVNEPNQDVHHQLRLWVQKYVDLSGYLGYDWEEVVAAYFKKRSKNIDRQSSGKY